MPDEKPADYDWVKYRKECSVFKVFKDLEIQAKKNTETREAQLTDKEQQLVAFRFEAQERDFAVIAENLDRLVRFSLDGGAIQIQGDGVNVDLEATLTLTNGGDCRLRVKGEELQPWQLLRMALEELFFDLRRQR